MDALVFYMMVTTFSTMIRLCYDYNSITVSYHCPS